MAPLGRHGVLAAVEDGIETITVDGPFEAGPPRGRLTVPPDTVPPGTGPADTGPLDPEESPGFLLWHVTLRWQRAVTAALAPLGLTHVQFVLLASSWWLNARGDEPNQLSVARQAGTDVKMTSEVLRKLEAKGLIVRTVDVADTRARRIHVTERGSDLAQAAVTAVEGVDAAFFAAVPDPGALLAMLRPLAYREPADIPEN